MFRSVNPWTKRIVLACALAAVATAGRAGNTPVTINPGFDSSSEEVEALRAPAAVAQDGLAIPAPAAQIQSAPQNDPNDKGSTFTNGASGLASSPPNALEMEKLALARAAIEAARQAGTLYLPATEEDAPLLTEEQINAIKMEQLRAVQPVVLPPDPVTGVGIDIVPVQISGPAVLSTEEAAKLATPQSPYEAAPLPPASPSNVTTPSVSREADAVPAPASETGRETQTEKEVH